jgi:sugar (pentulose or hexulose) kinase
MNPKPTAAQIIAAVREVAAENPGYVYPVMPTASDNECAYLGNGLEPNGGQKCGCLIGQAFLRVGLRIRKIEEGDSVNILLLNRRIAFTENEKGWLRTAQNSQDRSQPFGTCVKLADFASPLDTPPAVH